MACDSKNPEALRASLVTLRQKEGAMKRDEYRRVIAAASELGMVDVVHDLLSKAREEGRETTHIHNAAISGFGKAGEWERSLEVLRKMPIGRDVVSYNAALSTCVANKASHQLPRLLEEMHQDKIRRNTITYNIIIQERAETKGLEAALRVLKDMDEVGVKKDSFTFSNLIAACQPTGNWEMAISLLQRMRFESIRPSNVPYSAAISVCERAGVWEPALELLKDMHTTGIKPSQITLSAAISAFRHQPKLTNAVKTFQFMKVMGDRFSKKTYGSLMSAYASQGYWQDALDLLAEMDLNEVRPNTVIIASILEACLKAHEENKALELFKRFRNLGLPIDASSYELALDACRRGEGMEYEAELLCEDMKKEPFGLSTRAYNMIITMGSNNWNRRLDLFDNMESLGLRRDAFSYQEAFRAAQEGGAWERGLELIEQMEKERVDGTAMTYVAAIDSVHESAPMEALRLFDTIKDRRSLIANDLVVAAALRACASAKDGKRALDIVNYVVSMGLPKTVPIYTAALAAVKTSEGEDVAMELFKEASNYIQDNEDSLDLSTIRNFRSNNVDLRQKLWKDTWKQINSAPVEIEPEGQFTERFSRPKEYETLAVSEVFGEEDKMDADEVIRNLQKEGLVELEDMENVPEEIGNSLEEEWEALEKLSEEEIEGEEWEEIDPMSIPELAQALRDQEQQK